MKHKQPIGRPPIYSDTTRVCLCGRNAASKLQEASDRRAIVNYLIDAGGCASVQDINSHFGFDIRKAISDLVRTGWLEINDGA